MRAKYYLLLLLVVAIYFAAGRLGLSQAFLHANVSPVWPPTGIAIAAVWLFGYSISPAVLIGAFLVNLATGVSIATSVGIATGNMLEAVSAVYLLRKFSGNYPPFSRLRSAGRFVLITGLISTPLAATIGNLSLCLTGASSWSNFGTLWLTWWLGDGVGALVVTPLLLSWIDKPANRWTPGQIVEALVLLVTMLLVANIVFGGLLGPSFANYPLEHLLVPFLLWAAFSFGPPGAATSVTVLSAVAIWGTRNGFGPFATHGPNESLLLLQVFVAAVAITTLVLAAIVIERKEAAQALRSTDAERQQRIHEFQALIDTAPAGIAVAQDRECSYIWGNPEFLNMLGTAHGQNLSLTGPAHDQLPFRILRRGQEISAEDLPMQRACRENRTFLDEELEIIRTDGTTIHELCRATPLRDENGRVRGCIGIFLNITERKQAEKDREQLLHREQEARAAAEDASRVKDEFLAVISHELRTPLNSIFGWAQLLQSGDMDAIMTSRALDSIERNAKALAKLVDDLLDVSGIASGKLRLDIQPTELTSAINSAIDSVRHTVDSKEIQLEVVMDPATSHIQGDPTRLQQIMWNLLSNAVRFTPKGGRISIRLQRIGRNAHLTVTDSGEGIRPEFLPYVFDRFRQEDSSKARKHGGLGLGLAIVRHLVEIHGGLIEAYSEGENRGATFKVILPLADETPVRPGAGIQTGPDTVLPTLFGLRLLVVEDNHDSLEMLRAVVESHGAQVRTATTASEGFRIFEEWPADVLISDIGLPDEDGYALLQKIKASEPDKNKHLHSIALTGYAGEEEARRASDAGFQLCLTKPTEPVKLIQAIAKLAGGV